MSELQPLDASQFPPPERVNAGQAPELAFVPLANLRVDRAYQRPVLGRGKTTIKRIVASFRWSHFSPLIVAPLEGSEPQLYAVVDGQHRATAALACGFGTVPAYVISADRREQARAFSAINGCTTKITPMQLHHSALEAADEDALRVQRVADAAGVILLRYPVAANFQKPGQTMAIGGVKDAIKRHGDATVITALQCITETENNLPGVICGPAIKGLCAALDARPRWREAGTVLFDVMDELDIGTVLDTAKGFGPRAEILEGAVKTHLDAYAHLLPAGTGAAA